MQVELIHSPFAAAFDALIPALYAGAALQIKQTQPYATDYLSAGFLVRGAGEQPLARIGIYHNPALRLDDFPVVTLGAYECVPDETVSRALFKAVAEYLQTRFPGHAIVGPMDGSTWQTYRFVTKGADQPPFLLEPFALPWYPEQWQAAGWKSLMSYTSHIAEFDASDRIDFTPWQQKFENIGLEFRNLAVLNTDAELQKLAKFNLTAFREAFLFSPVSEAEFAAKNQRMITSLVPELVHLALDGPDICGLILAYPDRLDPSGQTAVVKTLARLPGDRYRGLGDLLCAKIVDSLLEHGYQKMIHALMRTGNASQHNSSRFWGNPYKEYALFQLHL